MSNKCHFSLLTLLLAFVMAVSLLASCGSGDTPDEESEGIDISKIELNADLLASKIGGFTIVRPDVAGSGTIDAAVALRTKLMDSGCAVELATDWVKRGDEMPVGTPEILVGTTNRPETEKYTADLRYHDFAVAKEGGRYVIVGGSDAATQKAVEWFVANALTYKGDTLCADGDSYIYHREYRLADAALNGVAFKDCQIACTSELHNSKAKAEELQEFLLENVGYKLEIVSLSLFNKNGGKGFLFSAPEEDGDADTYQVAVDGSALVISGATKAGYSAGAAELIKHLKKAEGAVIDSGFKLEGKVTYQKMEYYVDADAAPGGDGTAAKPFAGIEEALDAAAALASEGAYNFVFRMSAGNYSLNDPLVLDGQTFDLYSSTFEFICEDEERAIISAWVRVDGFDTTEKVNGVDAWVAKLPEVNGETLYPHQMFALDGTRLNRPRIPEEGYFYVEGVPGVNLKSAQRGDGMTFFTYKKGDIEGELTRLSDVQMCMPHWWNDEKLTVKSIDYAERLITFTTTSSHAFKENDGSAARYFLDNVFEALDQPGEIYADRESGKIYYIPREGEKQDGFAVYASNLEQILVLDGVHNVSFENIAFSGSDWKTVERKTGQAANDIQMAAVTINNATHIRFEDCEFTHIGTKGIRILQSVNNVVISRCVIDDIGAGAIEIVGVNMEEPDETVVHNIHITDCQISRFGRVFANGVGVLLRNAHDCTIAHNDIYDGYYTGISIGWRWGYDYSVTNNLLVEKNHIYDIGQHVLSDMGGIYSLGPQPGTVIRGNLIHDISMYTYGGWGIYPDEGSSEILIEKNICYNLTAMPFHQHYGKENVVRNNIFAFGDGGIMAISKKEEHNSLTLERNILLADNTAIYTKPADQLNMKDNANLIWDISNPNPVSGAMTYHVEKRSYTFAEANKKSVADMKAGGLYNNVLIADPLFKDPKNGDFTLPDNSPAYDIGFEPIDMSDVGVRK